jgi:hypothetical protein
MTRNSIFILLISLITAAQAEAKGCLHKNLSKKYDYQIAVEEGSDKGGVSRISKIYVTVISKQTKAEEQTIVVNADKRARFSAECFKSCNRVQSTITDVNTAAPCESDRSDLIVTDLNFDGEEDLMIKTDCGGGGKSSYAFFTKNDKGLFQEDRFLTKQIRYYPSAINEKSKTVSMVEKVGAWGQTENVYRYDSGSRKWMRIKTMFR